ncbi:hypothetical protein [Methylobacterium dankookense]|uniref:Uncharacterized protein n=1 Tax=Methylobacterium dankookense TaxID=560405 RepID=A0A564FVW6_9HYPH|nr:hypothetical protein [Methylobacterium dankookense]GJD58460.1 hypothetical protein IFDJLNFL_4381 [Methylobacterium dankookense]VUF12295.1 hypothetical protein MTDSW087_01984 [Methylobacterium dankookense]
MLVNHARRLLRRAAEAADLQISIRQKPDLSWPSDHSRLVALESRGDLLRIDLRDGRGTDKACATWQITDRGLANLQHLSGSAV